MEWIVILVVICTYSSLSSKMNRMINNLSGNKKKFSSLGGLLGKKIEIEIEDYLDYMDGKRKGILKEYNDNWIVLESRNKKNQKETYYYKIENITSINIIED